MTTTIGDTPPSAPAQGDAWWDSVGGQLYVWFNDGSSAQWVIAVNQPGPQGLDGRPGPVGPIGPPGPPGFTPPPIFIGEAQQKVDDLNRLYDMIQLQMPGVTTDNVTLQAWLSIQDFYMRSTYRREHVYWRMNSGVVTLSFDPWDSHWRVFRFLDFRGLSRVKFEPPGRIRDLTWPHPDTVRNGEVLIALYPIDANAPLGDDFWAMWFDTVVSGTLARLYLQPAKPYTDASMGRVQQQLFQSGCAQARAHVQAMFVTDGIPWRYPYFAYGRSKNGGWGGPG